jgi:DegV family protein with EDD domain
MLNILTDSTSDLGTALTGEFNLKVIPLTSILSGRTYLDGIDIDQENLFKLVAENGELPTTAAPSVGELERFFDLPGDSVFIGISSQLSATIQNAQLAASKYPAGRVRVVDSLSLSAGVGLLALRAAQLRDQGLTAGEIAADLQQARTRLRVSFMIDTMEFLYKGGRCSALQAIAGSVLKIHPVIAVRPDGTLGVKDKARGTRQRGLQLLLDDFAAHVAELDLDRVFVTHTTCEADAQFLRDQIQHLAVPRQVYITRAGSVVSSHCGPRTIGILYFARQGPGISTP